jgi:hypothetical protein
MSPNEIKICLEFLRGGFCDYGTPKTVMFLESEVEEFKEFINEKLEELKDLRKFIEECDEDLDGF